MVPAGGLNHGQSRSRGLVMKLAESVATVILGVCGAYLSVAMLYAEQPLSWAMALCGGYCVGRLIGFVWVECEGWLKK